MTIFTNALFDHGDRDWLHDPKIPPTPGACVFWDGGGRFASFDAMANKQCVSYVQAPWQRLEVCAACE